MLQAETKDERLHLQLALAWGKVFMDFIICGQGFFVPYLTGGISIAVLAVGSTAPGLLQFFINKCARQSSACHWDDIHLLLGSEWD